MLIDKPGGGVRPLGIPTTTDRLIQQAIGQVLSPIYEPVFSEHSYGFRPGRSAHDGIQQALSYINQGYDRVVKMDLKSFFNEVNHDYLMHLVRQRITDKPLLKLIRRYVRWCERTDRELIPIFLLDLVSGWFQTPVILP